jgi:tetratricopeptide (TPR) repeat protein
MATHTPESLFEQARNAKRNHHLNDAASLFRSALKESRTSEDHALRATLYEELAYVERNLRDLEAAQEHYLQSAEIYRRLDSPLKTAHTLRHAADILREQNKLEEAARSYSEALAIYRQNRETPPLHLANAIRGFAILKTDLGERQQALKLWQEARDLYRQENIAAGVSESSTRIASLTSA